MKSPSKTFKQGDPVAVEWEDIQINSTGNPNEASTARRVTMGFYKGVKDRKTMVLMAHEDIDPGQEGWTAIPLANVLSITEVVKTEKRWERRNV